jgi:hypothetical protein
MIGDYLVVGILIAKISQLAESFIHNMAVLSMKHIQLKQVALDNIDIFIQLIFWVSFGT